MIRFFFTLGLNQRLVWRCEWLILLPVFGRLPVSAHTLLMTVPLGAETILFTTLSADNQAVEAEKSLVTRRAGSPGL
jgi:hypothetical protein